MDQLSGGITWTYQKPIIPSGKLPGGRCGASLVYADGKLVTFGGHYYGGADKFEYENETWLLDTEKLVWHKILEHPIAEPFSDSYAQCQDIFWAAKNYVF